MKPAEYSESRIVTEDAPYHVEDLKGTHSDPGMLHLGRVVWGKKSPEGQSPEQRVSVYAEGVGLVSLESERLLGGDAKVQSPRAAFLKRPHYHQPVMDKGV